MSAIDPKRTWAFLPQVRASALALLESTAALANSGARRAEIRTMTQKSSSPKSRGKIDKQIALALQGGGALGSYQAGVFEALAEYDYQPDWVAGISIGATNCAIIAGNPQEDRVARLRQFWQLVSSPTASWLDFPQGFWQDAMRRSAAM